MGDLVACEKILRTILESIPTSSSDYCHIGVKVMGRLSELLINTSRASEAVFHREKIFLIQTKTRGTEHRFSRTACKKLGFLYAQLGRYNDAIRHFQETTEKITLDRRVNLETRTEYTKTLHEWIQQVELTREQADTAMEEDHWELDGNHTCC